MWSVIGVDGKEYGPVNEQTLREWIMQGRINPESQLLGPSRRPIRAGEIPGLFPGGPMTVGYPRPGYGSGATKSKLVAILLAFFLGSFGIHRFYLGYTSVGVAMLLGTVAGYFTCGISAVVVGIWALVDTIRLATGSLGDKDGAALV